MVKPIKRIIPDTVVGKTIIIIEGNIRDIEILENAEKLYMNDRHLSKVFMDECGVNFLNYLIL